MKIKQLLEIDESEEVKLVPPIAGDVILPQQLDYFANDPYLKTIDKQINSSFINIKLASAPDDDDEPTTLTRGDP